MTCYNTNNLKGVSLQDEERDAMGQENAVQAFFNAHPEEKFLSSDVHHQLVSRKKVPDHTILQSIRRAISNLKKAGRIDRLTETAIGAHGYGKSEHYYQLSAWVPVEHAETSGSEQ